MRSAIVAIFTFFIAINTYASTYGAKIIKDDVKVKCYSDGRKEWIEEKEIKILNRQGVKEFGEVVIPFSHEHQKVKILYAYTVLPDGRVVKPQKDAFNIVYPPFQAMAPIYSDLRYQTISMPAVKPGAVLKYAFKIETVKPYMKNQFWTTNFFQSTYPVEHSTFKLSIPTDKKVKIKEYNFHKKPVIKKKGKRIEYFYELNHVPPLKEEPSMPPLSELAKKVVVTSLSSWNQVARWYSDLAKEALKPDDYVKETTLKVIKDKKSKLEQIKAIYNFVAQNIRYVGLEFGINGYKPHTASSVLKNRYGDCKDHATLLIAMLKVIGVKGYPVLIPTQGIADMDLEMPTPTAFNHEIAAIKTNGTWLFLDTTADTVPFGELPAQDQGRHVLIVDVENGTGIIEKTPIYPAETNREEFVGNFTVDDSGNLKGNLLFNYTGVYAHRERAILSSFTTPYEEKQFIERTVSSVIPGFEVEKFKISNYKNLNKKNVYLSADGVSPLFATKTKHLMLFHAPVPTYSRLISLVASKERTYPYVIGYKMMKDSKITIELPKGYKLYFLPEDFSYKNSVGSINLCWKQLSNGKIKMSFRMKLEKAEIPVKEYGKLRELFNLTVKTLQNQIVILKKVEK